MDSPYNFFCLLWLFCIGCGMYSFTGAAISPEVKTMSVEQFYNNALLGPSDMNNMFSEKLRQYFERNTSLRSVSESGDLQFSGQIESYVLSPVAPQASGNEDTPDYAALTRLTLEISVTYINVHDDTFDFEGKNFSFFKDFDQNRVDLNTKERDFVEEIMDQIVIDIFNQSLANW